MRNKIICHLAPLVFTDSTYHQSVCSYRAPLKARNKRKRKKRKTSALFSFLLLISFLSPIVSKSNLLPRCKSRERERERIVCVCVCVIDYFCSFQLVCCFFLFTPAVSWIRLHTWRRHEAHHVLHFVFFCFAPFYSDAGWSVDFMLFSINSLTDGSSSRQFPIRRWREGDNNVCCERLSSHRGGNNVKPSEIASPITSCTTTTNPRTIGLE